jgi:hypothetical protein
MTHRGVARSIAGSVMRDARHQAGTKIKSSPHGELYKRRSVD